ncbi:DMT family transporter [Candidatus Woesearchaeota archaeon]|nr:DMT family transporter [Candidatus Woesearchaeota archaeon]
MFWVVFALAGTFLWACANVFDKVLREKYLKDSIALTALFAIPYFPIVLILFAFIGVPHLPFWHGLAAFACGFIFPVAAISYFKALSLEEASRVVPLFNLSPVFVLFMAVIFLGEVLTPVRYLAFFLILVGGLLISARRLGRIFHLSRAAGFMLLGAFVIAVMDVLLKFSLGAGDFWHVMVLYSFGTMLGELSLFILPKVRKSVSLKVFSGKRIALILIPISLFFGFTGDLLYNRALFFGPVTIVSSMISFQSLFLLVIATFLSVKFPLFLKEAIDRKTLSIKLAAIILMAAGLFLLSL